jgi:hypothetical protein
VHPEVSVTLELDAAFPTTRWCVDEGDGVTATSPSMTSYRVLPEVGRRAYSSYVQRSLSDRLASIASPAP